MDSRVIGGITAEVFAQYENLGKRYRVRHLWSCGYCVSKVGLDEEKIPKYVKWLEEQEKFYEVK
jgi:hypothetical protein